jgi:hypothetical protein
LGAEPTDLMVDSEPVREQAGVAAKVKTLLLVVSSREPGQPTRGSPDDQDRRTEGRTAPH